MTAPFHEMSARDIAAGVRRGRFKAERVATHFLERIEKFDGKDKLNAFLHVNPRLALQTARAVDAKVAAGRDPGPLAGVPVALKDNLCVRHMPTTCASKILGGWVPPYDADAVTKLLAAGAVPLGKTNLDEFAMGSSTENSAFGPTRNPWNHALVPGGSSGGSAAAVAAGLAPLAFGSDTGGSIRQPAALCGVHGMMGTYGRVSRRGLVAFGSSLDRIGPFARNVGDLALAMQVLCGGDAGDATTLDRRPPPWAPEMEAASYTALEMDVRGLRVGVLRAQSGVDAEVSAKCDAAANALRAAGATVTEIDLPAAEHAVAVYYLVAPSEASSNLARYDGVRFGLRAGSDDGRTQGSAPTASLDAMLAETRERGFGPEVKRRILLGTFALSAGYSEAFYEKALRVRRLIADDFARAFETCDVVVSPTSPFPAFPIGAKADDPLAMYLCDLFTIPASLAGLPAASMPVGATKAGLPVGLQVVAPALREDRLFRIAAELERVHGPAPLPEAYR
jgi:aspartyl-tRNA(Asn)/glutamyl-tRNA(Gln) amidotransferase subunit A